jgi:hypothetical protein
MDPVLFVRLAPVWVRPGPVAVVVAIQGRQAGVTFDAVALLRRGARVGALCLRLELGPAGWRVVEAARPEDGALPEPDLDPSDAELEAYAQVVDR